MESSLTLDTPVSKVFLVGPASARRLERLGIETVRDLLYHLPFRYEDYSIMAKANSLQEGETVTLQGRVLEIKNEYTRGGFVLQKAVIEDETGSVEAMWFNQRFLTGVIHRNDLISISGLVKRTGNKLQIISPQYEIVPTPFRLASQDHLLMNIGNTTIHTGRLVPVYPETAGVTSKWLRVRIHQLLKGIREGEIGVKEYLDENTREKYHLMDLESAIQKVHFPDSLDQAAEARRRLALDELLWSQILARKRQEEQEKSVVGNRLEIVNFRQKLTKFVESLPFTLTAAQKRVINEIYQDLSVEKPMNRLLQGDVGSGKTVVAALAMLAAYFNGYQAALMAPTEILAGQHFETLNRLLRPLKIKVGIATGSKKDYQENDIVVGTHALLSDKLDFKNLGLVVIDEQHRFGVEQRAKLLSKGAYPHLLTMTATPIPRTVALTLYGDLDLSIIDEMPKDRLPIKTWVVPKTKREAAYEWIKNQHSQAFIICPLIEESETLKTVKSAKKEFDRLSKEVFPDLKLGLLHGRMKPKEKEEVLKKFKEEKLDILVATPVVEVGIDIPSATIMVIEAADRFGLAQLHQLRGRVGRGEKQSYCLLFTENSEESGWKRLKFMEKHHRGLELAEIDLRSRGPGQRFGSAQHGRWDLKIADFNDLELVEKSHLLAKEVLSRPDRFPFLQEMMAKSKIKSVPN